MNIENMIDFNKIEEIIIISNTSNYFYNNMVEEKTVKEIGKKYSVGELFSIFTKYCKGEIYNNIESLIIIYCIIFALTYKDYDSVEKFFNNLDSYNIRWCKEIKDIYFSRIKATTIIIVSENYSYKNSCTSNNYEAKNSIII